MESKGPMIGADDAAITGAQLGSPQRFRSLAQIGSIERLEWNTSPVFIVVPPVRPSSSVVIWAAEKAIARSTGSREALMGVDLIDRRQATPGRGAF
jgi:hypothetical protein